jgi:hypothetical protein
MTTIDSPGDKLNRRHLLRGVASLAAFSMMPGCSYKANSRDATSSGSSTPVSPAPFVHGSLTVDSSPIGAIPPRFIGLSYEKLAMTYGYFHPSNHNLIAMFRLLGAGVLRIGGGSVDQLLWTTNATGNHAQITSADIKALAGFLQATGWLCLYGVNLITSTPALAAEEVAAAVSALGGNLFGIELGNEPDEYGVTQGFLAGDWNYQDFVALWNSFHSAIVQVAPNVAFTGPATGGGNHITSWTLPFDQAVMPSKLTLLTQHYYRASGASPTSTASFLISPDTQLVGDLAILNAGAQQLGLPYRVSECNSFYNGGAPGVSNSYASSLWVIDFLFDSALGGASGVNMHGGGNAPGYTPIADDSGAVIEARPEYYGLLLFSLVGPGALLASQLSAGSVDSTAYAVKVANGDLNLVVVNKDTVQTLTLTIETGNNIRMATMQIMTGSSLAALSGVTIQGATVNSDGSFAPATPGVLTSAGAQTTCSIPPLSAGLITISFEIGAVRKQTGDDRGSDS